MVLFDSIIEGIKTILLNESKTGDVIESYRKFHVTEAGIEKMPLCVIMPTVDADLLANYIGGCRHFNIPIEIWVLGRVYNLPARHQEMLTVLDQLQHDVCDAITADNTLSDSVLDSNIAAISYIQPGEEYFGFKVTVMVKTNIE